MKTTLYLEQALLKKVKADAVRDGVTLTAYTEMALRETLARKKSSHKHVSRELPVFEGDGFLPGVDISDSSSLLDIMEGQ
ncbi:MAG: hypothetical protein ABUK01_12745 [Leptospirales bacterium]